MVYRLQEEIKTVLQNRETVTIEDLNQLQYTEQVSIPTALIVHVFALACARPNHLYVGATAFQMIVWASSMGN